MFYLDNSLYSDRCLPYHSNMSMDLVPLLTSLLNPFSKNMTCKPTLIHTSFISHKLFIWDTYLMRKPEEMTSKPEEITRRNDTKCTRAKKTAHGSMKLGFRKAEELNAEDGWRWVQDSIGGCLNNVLAVLDRPRVCGSANPTQRRATPKFQFHALIHFHPWSYIASGADKLSNTNATLTPCDG